MTPHGRFAAARHGWLFAAGACALVCASACGGRHVKLMFGHTMNETPERHLCGAAAVNLKPEQRDFNCTDVLGPFPAEVGNSGRTIPVDIPDCKVGKVMAITIMDADRANPRVYVSCGQATSGHDLGGGLPATPPGPPPAPQPAQPVVAPPAQADQPTTTGHDLRGGNGF